MDYIHNSVYDESVITNHEILPTKEIQGEKFNLILIVPEMPRKEETLDIHNRIMENERGTLNKLMNTLMKKAFIIFNSGVEGISH